MQDRPNENCSDLDRNREFLFNLVYKFYDNQIKDSESTNTFLGFIIAANGVILLGLMTLTFTIDKTIFKWQMQLVIVLTLLFTCLSIWCCLAFILRSKPIPFSVSEIPLKLIDQKYSDLHNDAFEGINTIIKANTKKYEDALKFLIYGMGSFGISLVMIIVLFGVYFYLIK